MSPERLLCAGSARLQGLSRPSATRLYTKHHVQIHFQIQRHDFSSSITMMPESHPLGQLTLIMKLLKCDFNGTLRLDVFLKEKASEEA